MTVSSEPAVVLDSIQFAYNGVYVLEGISLSVHAHDFLAIIGPNGGGKTTLLKIIAGLLEPSGGTVRLFGGSPSISNRRIGYVTQNTGIHADFPISVLDVTLMGRIGHPKRFGRYTDIDHARAISALDSVGMKNFSKRRIGTLSGGQRQRVFLARALACEPDMLVLDEPTAGVDAEGRKLIYDLLSSLRSQMTILVASHDQVLLFEYSTHVAYMNRTLHLHKSPILNKDAFPRLSGIPYEDVCPAELYAPQRIIPDNFNRGIAN